MKAAAVIMMAALAACGDTTPLPCTGEGFGVCAEGGQCIHGFCANADGACASGYRYDQSAGTNAGECADPGGGSGSGNAGTDGGGIPGNDEPIMVDDTATHVLAPATNAVDDIKPSCGTTGGIDVMFDVNVVTPYNRLYLNTEGTSFDVVLAVYSGGCATAAPADELDCVASGARACSGTAKQWSRNLAAGRYCVVVDQMTVSTTHSAVVLNLMSGPPALDATVGANPSTTCGHNDWQPYPGCPIGYNGPDVAWFFMTCGDADYSITTAPTSWAGDLEEGSPVSTPQCDAGAAGHDLYEIRPTGRWYIAHQVNSACSSVSLVVTPI